jgi:hypothetical protein
MDPDEPEAAGAPDWVVVVLALPTLATALCTGPPPQAVSRTLEAASTARGRPFALVICPLSHKRAREARRVM